MVSTRKLALACGLFFSAGLTNAVDEPALSGSLDCTPQNAGQGTWMLELDERIPIAVVREEDRPADYSPSHVRIRLSPDGATMTIGRSSGRYLASNASGEVFEQGRCRVHATA